MPPSLLHLSFLRFYLPVSMASHLNQLQPSSQLLLDGEHYNHNQDIEPEGRPEPQASEAESDEAAPVQQ